MYPIQKRPEFVVGDRIRPKCPHNHWVDEKLIVDRIFLDDKGDYRIDFKVCFKTGGCFLARGLKAEWYAPWHPTHERKTKGILIRKTTID